ncbi:MAG: hypothetical protein MJZ14_08510 [Paludibacteraceae bacterium]|nr:hypothetical protein [Paludibacteraceae bacterium]
MKNVFLGLLAAASVLLAYMCYRSVMNPIEFDEQKAIRDEAVIQKLMNIRKAQIAHKEATSVYAKDLNSLIDFVNNGSIPNIVKVGELTDDQMKAGLTEEIAVALSSQDEANKYGIHDLDSFMANFRRDTVLVKVKESIFGKDFDANTLGDVPFSDGKKITVEAVDKFMTSSNLEVPLFQAYVSYNDYLQGLNKQEIINLNEEAKTRKKYAGLKVGDTSSPNNNAGNWE